MTADILIQNGRVLDPARGIDQSTPVAVKGRRIIPWEEGMEAKTTIDASGCLVTPGLIDFHAHIYERGTDSGANPDLAMLPYGVTTVVDAGSSGVSTYRSFLDRLALCRIKTKFFLHISPTGQVTHQYPELLRPERWNMEKFQEAVELAGDKLLGFKLRVSRNVVGDTGLRPLEAALELAISLSGGPEAELEARELGRAVSAFLAGQPERNRGVFLRRYWYGDTVEEAARWAGWSLSRTKSALFRMRKKLKDYLKKEGLYHE